jgi:hypothetical protein
VKCYPDDRRPTMSEQLAGTLFDAQTRPDADLLYAPLPTPSGPQTPVPTRALNSFNAYCAWKRSDDGGRAMGWMLTRAREQLAAGEQRIGMKALTERCREMLKVALNNAWTAWLADDLVAADPRLLPLIERRVRRKAKA